LHIKMNELVRSSVFVYFPILYIPNKYCYIYDLFGILLRLMAIYVENISVEAQDIILSPWD
jgi:hypothetical protein